MEQTASLTEVSVTSLRCGQWNSLLLRFKVPIPLLLELWSQLFGWNFPQSLTSELVLWINAGSSVSSGQFNWYSGKALQFM